MSVPVRVARLILRGDLPVSTLRRYTEPANRATPTTSRQLSLWIRDRDGLPERPWTLGPESRFDCVTLACRGMRVAVCIARQVASDGQRTRDTWRGQGSEYPTCVTERCAQGRAIREAVAARTPWIERRAQPYLRRGPLRADQSNGRRVAESVARRQQARVGLLAEVRTIDTSDDEAEDLRRW